MNADTGRIYEMGEDVIELLDRERARSTALMDALAKYEHPDDGDQRTNLAAGRALGRQLTKDEQAALYDTATGQRVVPVSADVAHTMKLGQRERERRAKRRKAAKESRRRNRM